MIFCDSIQISGLFILSVKSAIGILIETALNLYTALYIHEHRINNFTSNCLKKKYLEVNLSKEVEDLYSENGKTGMNRTEDDTNKWKGILCSCIERISTIKISILLKACIDSTQSLSNSNGIIYRNRINKYKIGMELPP